MVAVCGQWCSIVSPRVAHSKSRSAQTECWFDSRLRHQTSPSRGCLPRCVRSHEPASRPESCASPRRGVASLGADARRGLRRADLPLGGRPHSYAEVPVDMRGFEDHPRFPRVSSAAHAAHTPPRTRTFRSAVSACLGHGAQRGPGTWIVGSLARRAHAPAPDRAAASDYAHDRDPCDN